MTDNIQELISLALGYNKKVTNILLFLQGFHEDNNISNNTKIKQFSYPTPNTEGDEMRQLKRGQGTIIKRERQNKDGSVYMYYLGKYYLNNIPKYVTAKSYTECYNKLASIRKENKKSTPKTTGTLQAWLIKWLDIYKRPFIEEKTAKDYETKIKKYIPENILNKALKQIRASDLQKIINEVAAKHGRTARTVYDIINGSFNQAYNSDLIKVDVTKGLLRPKYESQEEIPLSKIQQNEILNKSNGLFKLVLIGYIWTGCRVSELLTLKWEYWNTKEETLFINGTKNKRAKRTIPIFPPLKEILETLPHTSEFIFDISEKTLDRHKETLTTTLGWNFTLKSLRHTYNQNLHDLGIPDIVRAAWMGHSKPTTTNKVYTHMTNELQIKAIETVFESLKPKK